MPELIGRKVLLSLISESGKKYDFSEAFTIKATIEKSLKTDEPDTADITIYNLNSKTRSALSDVLLTGTISAGYPNTFGELLTGNVVSVIHLYKSPDWITRIKLGDDANPYRDAILNKTYKKDTPVSEVVSDIAELYEVKEEYIGNNDWAKSKFKRGKSFSSSCRVVLDQVARNYNLQWTLQAGKLVLSQKNEGRTAEVISLRSDTGLISSPSVQELDRLDGYKITVDSLVFPAIVPGSKVLVSSRNLGEDSIVIVKRVSINLTSREQAFYMNIEGAPEV